MQISISNIVKGSFISNAFIAISRYFTRVTNDGGIYEKPLCVEAGINSSPLFQQASFLFLPSGYKGGVAYSELPANGSGDLSWVRAGDAWRTNASGLIQRVPWNLIPNSQVFSGWQKVTVGTTVTVTDNAITAPNGTMTAARVLFSTFSTSAQIYQAIPSPSAGVFTTSIYAKVPSGTKQILFGFFDGTIKTQTRTLTTEWQRIEYSTTLVSFGSSRTCWLYGDDGTSNVEIHIWGGQHVEGSSAQTYFPTTDRLNVPRLSYMYGSCPALLLEPQRTNLALQSESFDNAYWTKNATSVTANTTTSPDGTTNADKIVENSATSEHFVNAGNITFAAGAYTISVYAKASERSVIQLFFNGSINIVAFANFDLANGVVGSTGSGTTATITSVGNGWYRCAITATCVLGTAPGLYYCIQTSTTATRAQTYTGNGTSGLFLYGAQLELGAYPTTLISTTTASATRIADSFSRNNIYTNGLITSSGGTWFVELRGNLSLKGDVAGDGIFLQTVGNTDNFRLYGESASSSRIIIYKRVSNVNTLLYTTTTDTTKLAIKWNGSTADVFANGTKVVSATTFTATQMQDFVTSINATPKFIQSMGLHPTPLTDAQCIELTTL